MISYIEISDFAVIKDLKLELFPGLNILTGETGAGKSVIIEAISMALGARADTDYVRKGSDKAVISLMAESDDPGIDEILEDIGAPKEQPLLIRREISAAGRSICRVNGMPVPLSGLSRLCKKLADIHGQYDQQYLLDPDKHIDILDLYASQSLKDVKQITKDSYRQYADASTELMRLRKKLAESMREKELLAFETEEISNAALVKGEDEELEAKISLMQNAEHIFTALSSAYGSLYAGDQSVLSQLGNAMEQTGSVSSFSADLSEISERISNSYYELEDISSVLRGLKDSVSYSQEELDEAVERLESINSLKRKYGGSIESILDYAAEAQAKLSYIENADEQVASLERRIQLAREQYDAAAARLSRLRKDAAGILEVRIDRELSELNFSNARFKVKIEQGGTSENGTDRVEFLISANTGEDPKPLAKVASGGELSRIMLALKRIIGDIDGIPTMIFDEIDTGISGATAGIVGEKLHAIAENHQVICITHLPQIAVKGDHHFKIEKHSDEISTHTTVVPLSEEERVEEVARLLSGTTVSQQARLAAMEMLGRQNA